MSFRAGTDRERDDHESKFRAPEMLEACKTVSLVERARWRSFVVGGKSGSRDVVFPIPNVGLLEKRPAV